MRGLRLYEVHPGESAGSLTLGADGDELLDARVHARSRFRSVTDPGRQAIYSVHDSDRPLAGGVPPPPTHRSGQHTLVAVREFRRVPLHASALALMLFTARPGCAAQVLAALAHFVERAVSVFQPAYLLLAHSLEQPRISALVMGVHECAALQAASPAAFSVDALLPEIASLLAAEPEWFAYCPEEDLQLLTSAVSPYAV